MPADTIDAIRAFQWTFTFFAVAWSLNQLRQAAFKPAEVLPDGTRRLRMPRAFAWLAYGSIAFWVALIVLSTIYPGRTKPDDLVWAQSVFAFFAVLSAFLVHTYHTSDAAWGEAAIRGPNWYGKKVRIEWEDVIDCAYSEGMQAFTIKGRDGQTIWLTEYLAGLDDFIQHLSDTRPGLTLFREGRYRRPPTI
jgi:hypothetical protein